jgi:hypothetical protein
MNAFSTFRGRRLLPFLAMCCLLAGLPMRAHGGLLTSRLADRASLTTTDSSAPDLTARVIYESQGENESQKHAPEHSFHGVLAAAALILVVPAGTASVFSQTRVPPPPPPHTPTTSSTTSSTTPPGGHTSGGSTPEPGSLVLALTGSSTALLVWLRRRRNTPMICRA